MYAKLLSYLFLRVRKKILEKKKGPISFLLWVSSFFFAAATWIHRRFYTAFPRFSYTSSSFVISIGSPIAGGRGKTPFTLFLLSLLPQDSCAVLSRGYLSTAESSNAIIPPFLIDPEKYGDEPSLIAKNYPKAMVIVGKNRAKSAKIAEAHHKKLLILDDGMQHRKLQKNIEIILLKASDLHEKLYYLPRGFFREHLRQMKNADLLVIEGESFDEKALRKYTKAPIVLWKKELKKPIFPPNLPFSKDVAVLTSIACPELFIDAVKKQGFSIKQERCLRDHAPISSSLLTSFWKKSRSQGAKCILCTEKDFIKLPKNCSIPVSYIPMSVKIHEGEAHLRRFVDELMCLFN